MIRDRRASELAELYAVAQERARLLELSNEALRKLTHEADRRKELIDGLTAEAENLRGEIDLLRTAIGERDGEIALLRLAIGERDGVIGILRTAIAEREAQGEIFKRAADERLEGLERLDEALEKTRVEAEKRATLLAEMSEVLERQDREIARLRSGEI